MLGMNWMEKIGGGGRADMDTHLNIINLRLDKISLWCFEGLVSSIFHIWFRAFFFEFFYLFKFPLRNLSEKLQSKHFAVFSEAINGINVVEVQFSSYETDSASKKFKSMSDVIDIPNNTVHSNKKHFGQNPAWINEIVLCSERRNKHVANIWRKNDFMDIVRLSNKHKKRKIVCVLYVCFKIPFVNYGITIFARQKTKRKCVQTFLWSMAWQESNVGTQTTIINCQVLMKVIFRIASAIIYHICSNCN